MKERKFVEVTLTDYLGRRRVMLLPPRELAVIAIDLWDTHTNKELGKLIGTNIRSRVLPLLSRLDSTVRVHCFCHGRDISRELEKLNLTVWPEWTRWRKIRFSLETRKIRYFLFVGYASNMCLLNRPIVSMPVLHRRARRLGGGAILVSDCTTVDVPDGRALSGASRGEWNNATETLIQACFSLGSTESASIRVVDTPIAPLT